MSLLERCPYFRGCYVQASYGVGPEDVSLLERCPLFSVGFNGVGTWMSDMYRFQWSSNDLCCI